MNDWPLHPYTIQDVLVLWISTTAQDTAVSVCAHLVNWCLIKKFALSFVRGFHKHMIEVLSHLASWPAMLSRLLSVLAAAIASAATDPTALIGVIVSTLSCSRYPNMVVTHAFHKRAGRVSSRVVTMRWLFCWPVVRVCMEKDILSTGFVLCQLFRSMQVAQEKRQAILYR